MGDKSQEARFFVEYNNDTGPNDDYFHQFWTIKFGFEHKAWDARVVIEQIWNEDVAKVVCTHLNTMPGADRWRLLEAIDMKG